MALSYFTVFQNFGHAGLEGISHPEMTRRNVVDAVRTGEWSNLYAIHFVDMETGFVEDVTEAIKQEAGCDFTEHLTPSDRLAWLHDHARDLRKVN